MAADSTRQNVDNLFDSFADHLRKHLNQLTSNNISKVNVVQNFDKDLHWHKLDLCFQSISKECTKLVVGFSKPPKPNYQDTAFMIGSLRESVNILWAWYEAFPISQGKTLSLELENIVFRLFGAVQDFIESLKAEGVSESPARLHVTGKIWETCKVFQSISKDNLAATLKHLSDSYQLLSDALTEFEEEVKNADIEDDFDSTETWKEEDRPLFQPSLGLVKAGKRLLKMLQSRLKTNGDISTNETISQLDEIAELADSLSPCVDDLILSLYPPTDHQLVDKNASLLKGILEKFIQSMRPHHYITDDQDNQWIDFILNALTHNSDKLSKLIIS